MNIQQYYRQSADISLNGSLAALMPSSIFLVYSIINVSRINLLLITAPFIIYSFLCFQVFLLNKQRAKKVANTRLRYIRAGNFPFLLQSNVLITYMPAPSLRMIIFNPKGMQIGEIRDMNMWKIRWFLPYFLDCLLPKKLGIFNQVNELEAVIYIRKAGIEIINCRTSGKEKILSKPKGDKRIYHHSNGHYYMSKNLFYTDLQVYDADSKKGCPISKRLDAN
ncbi:hypothetical protein [Cytobacillus sp. NCCP-133]|uniref:hypothetical protein n=1 Tax=Cytobacillus sp. NCCP-133 TaxID=766848 RepID=UPI0022304CAC|nr:hypothetical protein [Cytobacillus sp. NCCP-133]GLB61129.1 hypothetical protein NCCP133_32590 [Cytobacillus sp. NCCP-133]